MPEENPRHRRSYVSSVIALIVILALGFGCYYAWKIFSEGIEPTPAPAPVQETPPVVDTSASYASSSMRISVRYPSAFKLNDQYAYTGVSETKPIRGVQFTVPESMATGTDLLPDSYIAIEQLPRANLCTGDIYIAANVKPTRVTEGTTVYSLATASEGSGGERFEESVYAIASSSPCTAVRYFIHTSTVSATSSSVRPFDQDSLINEFDKIRQSLVLQ